MATASLGLMGAMLSVTGIFGLAAYSLSKRKRDLGIWMALGSQRRAVLQSALGRAVRLLAALQARAQPVAVGEGSIAVGIRSPVLQR